MAWRRVSAHSTQCRGGERILGILPFGIDFLGTALTQLATYFSEVGYVRRDPDEKNMRAGNKRIHKVLRPTIAYKDRWNGRINI